jgi:hypothetical protein
MAEPPGPDRAPPGRGAPGRYGLAGRAAWWETWVADVPSPTSLASAESRLRLHPTTPLRPTARRVLLLLRAGGPQRVDQLAAGLAAVDDHDHDELAGRWAALPVAGDPLLDAVELHGAHDLRHTYDLAGGRRHPGPGD